MITQPVLKMHECLKQFFSERYLIQEVKKQRATGRTRDGSSFPLSIIIKTAEEENDGQFTELKQGVLLVCGRFTLENDFVW